MNIIDTIRLIKEDKRNLLDASLRFVQYEKNHLLTEVAKIHLISAEQAFISASTSNAPDSEIRIGIGHLRDAFNTYQILLEKGRFPFFYFLKFKWGDEMKTSIYLKLASIASVIALVYEKIDDKNNYLAWKVTALNFANIYIENRPSVISQEAARMSAGLVNSNSPHPRPTGREEELVWREVYDKEMNFINTFSKVVKNKL